MEDIEETLEKIETQSFGENNTINLDLASDIEDNIAPLEEPHYILRSSARNTKLPEKIVEESESGTELLINLKDIGFDSEDLQGATLEDAFETIEGKNKLESIAEWPNDAYRDFMELVIEENISNNIGDKVIKFFNKYSNLEESPLPKMTKSGKDYLNQIKSPIDFKAIIVATYSGVDFKLYYHPIFRAIQALLQRPGVTDNFAQKGVLKKVDAVGRYSLTVTEGSQNSLQVLADYILLRTAEAK